MKEREKTGACVNPTSNLNKPYTCSENIYTERERERERVSYAECLRERERKIDKKIE